MADATTIKQRGIVKIKSENIFPLKKERTSLFIKNFKSRKIHHRRIGFHLAEIRIHSKINGEITCQTNFCIQSCFARPSPAFAGKWIVLFFLKSIKSSKSIRHDLDSAGFW